jgi:hypothetical protein
MDYFLLLLVPFVPAALVVACMLRVASAPTPPVPERRPAKLRPRLKYSRTHGSLVESNA